MTGPSWINQVTDICMNRIIQIQRQSNVVQCNHLVAMLYISHYGHIHDRFMETLRRTV